jgi:hypothetical protein
MNTVTTGEAKPAFTDPEDVRKLDDACSRRLDAERRLEQAKIDSERARADAIPLFLKLGVTEVPVDDEGIRFVPVMSTTVDEASIEAYVKRYAPDHYDAVFRPTRTFDMSALKALVSAGAIGSTALKHVTNAPGSPRLRRYDVK